MAKFKVGDKVVRVDGKPWPSSKEYLTVTDIWESGIIELNGHATVWEEYELKLYKEVKEDKMEKTFREVIADIKEGEVWENYSKKIKCHFDGIQIYHKDEARHTPSMLMLDRDKFTLQRKEYTFEESLAICENQNKIMESVITGHKYKIENNIVYYLNAKGHWIKYYVFHYEEIKGNWYIN